MSKLRSQLENLMSQQSGGDQPQGNHGGGYPHPGQPLAQPVMPHMMQHPNPAMANPHYPPQQAYPVPPQYGHPQVYQPEFHGYPQTAHGQHGLQNAPGPMGYPQQDHGNSGYLSNPTPQPPIPAATAAPVPANPNRGAGQAPSVGAPNTHRKPAGAVSSAQPVKQNPQTPEFQNIKSSLDRLANKLQHVTQAQQASSAQTNRSHDAAMLGELRREFEKINGLLRGLKQLMEAQNSGGQMNAEIQHISQTVRHLSDVQATQPDQIAMMANEIRSLGTQLEALIANSRSKFDLAPIQHELHQNFAALGSRLELLTKDNRSIDALAQAVENNHSKLLNRIDTIAAGSQAAPDEGLITQIRALEQAVAGLPRSHQMQGINGQLQQLASAMDQLGQPDESNAIVQRNLSSIESRLDEITRGLVAISSGGNNGGSEDLQRIEARVASLAKSVEDFVASGVANGPAADLSQISAIPMDVKNSLASFEDKLGAMANAQNLSSNPEHLVEIASYQNEIVEALHSLEAKIDGNPEHTGNGLVGNNPANDPRLEELVVLPDIIKNSLDSLDQKLALIDASKLPELDGLAAQINRLSERLDDLSAVPLQETDGSTVAFARDNEVIASKLEDLVARIDTLQSQMEISTQAPEDSGQQPDLVDLGFAQLEQQLETIAAQLGSTGSGEFTPLDSRLDRIEQGLASSRDVAIEVAMEAAEKAASQAAQEAANSMAGSFQAGDGAVGAGGIDPSVFSALAEDVRLLAENTGNSSEHGEVNFEGVEQALSNIVDRIGGLEQQINTNSTTSVDAIAMLAEQSQTNLQHVRSMLESLGANNAGGAPKQPDFAGGYQSQLQPNTFAEEALPTAPIAMEEVEDQRYPVHPAATHEFTQEAMYAADAPLQPNSDFDALPEVAETPAMQHGGENLAPVVENDVPLAPGTGYPEVPPAVQAAHMAASPTPPADEAAAGTDFIAAARRAAQAAQHEANAAQQELEANSKRTKAGGIIGKLPEMFAKRKKVMILAAAAVLVAALAIPLSSTFLGNSGDGVKVASQNTTGPEISLVSPDQSDDGDVMAKSDLEAKSDSTVLMDAPNASQVSKQSFSNDPNEDLAEDSFTPDETTQSSATVDQVEEVVELEKAITKAPMPPSEVGNIELRQAAANGDEVALFEVGRRYTDGVGVNRDLGEASKWYELSASAGFGPAQYRLGNFYEKGHGVKRDLKLASEWYVKAADAGNALAMHNLAVINATGVVTEEPDMKTAVSWFTRAADLGVKDSQVNLGILYTRGMGVEQNTVEAYKWFAIASKAGDADASAKRDTVANAMRPDQLEQARAEVALWKAKIVDPAANTVSIPDSWKNKNAESVGFTAQQFIQTAQNLLTKHGFDPGPADGLMGDKTRDAIMAFQQRSGLDVDGKLSQELLNKLRQDTI